MIDDAAVFPPGNAPLPDALTGHAEHRAAWYSELVGPLLLPVSVLGELPGPPPPRLGVIGDTGLAGLPAAVAAANGRWSQLEIPVAKRGEDPQPGLRQLFGAAAELATRIDIYVELPLTWGLIGALDTVAAERAAGARVAPKFRTGGLAAELFPTPVELAAVICACRDRDLPYKLTAGLHHALRHTDPETGFTHHGFLNVLAADLAAADGVEVAEVAELLASTDPRPVLATIEGRLAESRPRWVGYGSCRIDEPLADLISLGLLPRAGSES
ncbi:hypothetical protein JQS43_01425 [Natronosporangium hydrolyticum]|uniref:Uncharacterized protein n=1 Tax=Natronosporangium hydrolyticum TaxID=2811111 RepID=A0A895YLU4_9ACTN|nr:hypothetical protein [Natronosporangium hydrolyticum]QSB15070.1 hypothetical protein JQS43_01425 [Natronosporangium hydrolyticum]